MGLSLRRSVKLSAEFLRPLDLDRKAWELLVEAVSRKTGYPPELVDRVLRLAKDAVEGRL